MPRNNPLPPPVTGAVVRVTVQLSSFAQVYEWTFDYMASTNVIVSAANVLGLLQAFRTDCEIAITTALSAHVAIGNYIGAEMAQGSVPTQVLPPVNGTGTGSGIDLPGTVAVVVTKVSSLKGQHGRGRYYFGPVQEAYGSNADPNQLGINGVASVNGINSKLLLPKVVGQLQFSMCISTRPIAPTLLVKNAVPVTALNTNLIFGNVRRRREGRGI